MLSMAQQLQENTHCRARERRYGASQALKEQSSVAEEINRNVASIRDVTESISGQARESAQVSQDLNQLASQQQALMDQFRV